MDKDASPRDAVAEFLMSAVVAPCVRQLREDHGADAVGEVLMGRDTQAAADRLLTPRFRPDDRDLDMYWARLRLVHEDTQVELPLGDASMAYRSIERRADHFFDVIDDWYCETRTGWGQLVEIQWPADLTREGWLAAVPPESSTSTSSTERGRDQRAGDGPAGWVAQWRDARTSFEDHRARLVDLIGRRLTAIWTSTDERGDVRSELPIVLCFDNKTQLETCWATGPTLSLTWDTIDLREKTASGWSHWCEDYKWLVRSHDGGPVTDVALVNFPAPRHRFVAGADPFGLAVVTRDRGLTVFASGDDTFIDAEMAWQRLPSSDVEWVSATVT